MVIIHIDATDIIVPIISARCHPYDKDSLELFCASFRAIIEMKKPRISDPRCAESA